MATTLPSKSQSNTAKTGPITHRPTKGSGATGKLLLLIVLVGLLSAAVWGSGEYLSRLGSGDDDLALRHTVTRGELLVTVTEDGNVESASNTDIKCQVAGGSAILWIVDDGSTVKQGDLLVELDTSALDEQINTQRIAYEKARSAMIQAEKNYAVAKLAVQEYLEGTFKKELQDAEATITIALENLRSAQNSLEHAQRMFRKGYVSSLELEGQRFGVERCQLELDSARTAKSVLVDFTKVKMLQDLESQRDTAEALMQSEKAAFELEEARLKRLESQLAQCTITAPQDGMVVYANERRGRFGQDESTIEEGATVRERQTILRLPDLSTMQCKVNVHESKVEQIQPGMRARIRILDRAMTGSVVNVANQPEPTSFFSANVKEYATNVRIDGEPDSLRPGMTAEVEILVAHLTDAITVPVAAVIEKNRQYFCWVETTSGYERRELKLGVSDDQVVEVKDGLSEGDVVLLNPRSIVAEARETVEGKGQEAGDVSERFGEGAPAAEGRGGPGRGPDGVGPAGGGGRRGPGGPGGPNGPGGTGGGPNGPAEGGPGQGSMRSGPEGGRPDGTRGGGRGGFAQMDKDGDGKISREEAPGPMAENFDSMDTNADGFLDQSELEALRQRFQNRQP